MIPGRKGQLLPPSEPPCRCPSTRLRQCAGNVVPKLVKLSLCNAQHRHLVHSDRIRRHYCTPVTLQARLQGITLIKCGVANYQPAARGPLASSKAQPFPQTHKPFGIVHSGSVGKLGALNAGVEPRRACSEHNSLVCAVGKTPWQQKTATATNRHGYLYWSCKLGPCRHVAHMPVSQQSC
jgi:hypothetical protein